MEQPPLHDRQHRRAARFGRQIRVIDIKSWQVQEPAIHAITAMMCSDFTHDRRRRACCSRIRSGPCRRGLGRSRRALGLANKRSEGSDEAPIGAHRRHKVIRRHAVRLGEAAIVAVEFYQRLRMLGDNEIGATTTATPSRPARSSSSRPMAEPGERPDPALKTHPQSSPAWRAPILPLRRCSGSRAGRDRRGDYPERQPMRAE